MGGDGIGLPLALLPRGGSGGDHSNTEPLADGGATYGPPAGDQASAIALNAAAVASSIGK